MTPMAPGSAIVARHITVRGRVQGVFFRDWTIATAQAAGIAGWVRNRADGSVEIVAEGEAAVLDRFVGACRAGPLAARVEAVAVTVVAVAGLVGFERRATE